jgi:hypothetical protein
MHLAICRVGQPARVIRREMVDEQVERLNGTGESGVSIKARWILSAKGADGSPRDIMQPTWAWDRTRNIFQSRVGGSLSSVQSCEGSISLSASWSSHHPCRASVGSGIAQLLQVIPIATVNGRNLAT